ncbi:MAG: sialidase family protein [Anaerolineae bacterium]|nr:sialidase family protein [Anaerolineae bacterium]
MNIEDPNINISLAATYASRAKATGDDLPWVHPICHSLEIKRHGPLLPLADGSLLTVDAEALAISHDDGKSWTEHHAAAHGQDPTEPASCYLLEPSPGSLVMVYLDRRDNRVKFAWNSETGEPDPECHLELHAVRSLDSGHTWSDRQCLLDGYNANFFGVIQTRSGRLVVVAEHLITNPGRWAVCSIISDDQGQTWQRSNFIDLGGHGHHDGATEPTVAELGDGRLLMLIRTNLGYFWQAYSDDGGRYWRTVQPSQMDASSAPGHLIRLKSGRLVLVWNRQNPEGETWPLLNPGQDHCEIPASWHREELSIAVSEDDGQTWSNPMVIARLRGGQLSYPQLIERRPGELWLIAGFASRKWFNDDPVSLCVAVYEKDVLIELC